MRRFVIGDIHGANKALQQCLERSSFDIGNDLLIVLGDICDGYPETHLCFETLLTVKNKQLILGNHDWWALQWAKYGRIDRGWLVNGGESTLASYPSDMPIEHLTLLEQAKSYLLLDNKLFVHAGIDPHLPLEKQSESLLMWDRDFIMHVIDSHKQGIKSITSYNEVYLGHTPTLRLGETVPQQYAEVWMMDTGAGWGSELSIMDIDSKAFYQSDEVRQLYPNFKGR